MANSITGLRIICSILLLFCPALSQSFYALYIVAGFTDMIDGTVADFIFIVVCLIKLIPVLNIATWIYIWVVIIALVKVGSVISGYVMQKKFVAAHTVMNKVTGGLLFVLPFTVSVVDLRYSAVIICVVATFAAVHEGHYIRTSAQ